MGPEHCSRAGLLRRAAWAGGVAVAISAVGWIVWPRPVPETPAITAGLPPDPRLVYAGPFRNVHPDVDFVGDSRCADCHGEISAKFAQHPMGRSIRPIAEILHGQDLSKARNNPFEAFGSRFEVRVRGDRVWHVETRPGPDGRPVYQNATEVRYVVGSGNNGHSYLAEQDGYVYQTPISWFGQARRWDVSPGFTHTVPPGRPIVATCLYCHANRVRPVPGSTNRYEAPLFQGTGHGIGCERCHGPGEAHSRAREQGEPVGQFDTTIVNPARLPADLREAVCQQCHLEGESRVIRYGRDMYDYRPGMPLDAVWRVLVQDHHGDDRKAVNHVEQMYLSKCFQASTGKFGCATCHDPHEKVTAAKRVEHYRAACVRCHNCTEPLPDRLRANRDNDCTACHMPRFGSNDVAHTASTDHRIVRRPGRGPGASPPAQVRGGPQLLFFPGKRPDLKDPSDGRDLAIGLSRFFRRGEAFWEAAAQSLPALERAIAATPEDLAAWHAKALALRALGRPTEALAACEYVLGREPRTELVLNLAGTLTDSLGRSESSVAYWRQAVELNPGWAPYRANLARALAATDRWPDCKAECLLAIDLDPSDVDARAMLAECLLRAGDVPGATAAFAIIEQIRPQNLAELRAWFERRKAER